MKYDLAKAVHRCAEQEQLLSEIKHQLAQALKQNTGQSRRIYLEENTKWAHLGSRLRSMKLYQKLKRLWKTKHAYTLRMQMAKHFPFKTTYKQPIYPMVLEASDTSYIVRQPLKEVTNRPVVLHAIANFCLGDRPV